MSKDKNEGAFHVRFPVSGDEARDERERLYAKRLLAEGTLANFEEGVYYVVVIRHRHDYPRATDYGVPHDVYFAEISRAETRRVIIPEIPDLFSAMPTRAVARTALVELKCRARTWIRKTIKKLTGR